MYHSIQNRITGKTAVKIISSLERELSNGSLHPGDVLPPVRELAGRLGVSPATVQAAYRRLQERGVVVSDGRRGTRVAQRPVPPSLRRQVAVPGGVNLFDGNPDPALLPSVSALLAELDYQPQLYGVAPEHAGLIKQVRKAWRADGVSADGHCCVVNGSMDGIDRLLSEFLRPGDRVAVEDPGFTGHLDLITARGMILTPVSIDSQGLIPEVLEEAIARGVKAIIVTPRAQSPTGAAITEERAGQLHKVLSKANDVLLIEDDHANFIAGVPLHPLHNAGHPRWAHLRSFSKSFNPDLRVAVITGDEETMRRVRDRLVIAERWVSQLLQALAAALLADKDVRRQLKAAAKTYRARRETVIRELAARDVIASGTSGYNVWLPVREETQTVLALAKSGWAVAAGERFRLASPPGIRITCARLEPKDAARFAEDVRNAVAPGRSVTI